MKMSSLFCCLLLAVLIVACRNGEEITSSLSPEEKIRQDLIACKDTTKEVRCAVHGVDGWIYLQESLLNLFVPWKDNSASFIAFSDTLKSMGITLVVAPVPDKLQISFNRYMPGVDYYEAAGYRAWVEKLRAGGVQVVDAMEAFRRQNPQNPMFEPYESHFTFQGRLTMAKEISKEISEIVKDLPKSQYGMKDLKVKGTGNLYHLVHDSYKSYTVKVGSVMTADGKRYVGNKNSPIVLIGDSNAGFGLQESSDVGSLITRETGVECFTISKIGGGNGGAKFFKGKQSFLEGKKVLVWLFDGRELYGNFAMPEF